jgi:hypothetical protein
MIPELFTGGFYDEKSGVCVDFVGPQGAEFGGTRQSTHFLAYWKPRTVDRQLRRGGVWSNQDHSASNQFGRVAKGDTVWIVTIRSGRLHLVTRIKVEHVTSQYEAARLLKCNPRQLWEAEYHIIGAPGIEMPILDLDIHRLAEKLRFRSVAGNDTLTIRKNGEVAPQQLQTMRVLTKGSAGLLDHAAEKALSTATRRGEAIEIVPTNQESN